MWPIHWFDWWFTTIGFFSYRFHYEFIKRFFKSRISIIHIFFNFFLDRYWYYIFSWKYLRFHWTFSHFMMFLFITNVMFLVAVRYMSNERTSFREKEGSKVYWLCMPDFWGFLAFFLHFPIFVFILNQHPHFCSYWEEWYD